MWRIAVAHRCGAESVMRIAAEKELAFSVRKIFASRNRGEPNSSTAVGLLVMCSAMSPLETATAVGDPRGLPPRPRRQALPRAPRSMPWRTSPTLGDMPTRDGTENTGGDGSVIGRISWEHVGTIQVEVYKS